jgi:hypothetical protein
MFDEHESYVWPLPARAVQNPANALPATYGSQTIELLQSSSLVHGMAPDGGWQ